ncbi:mitochondrial distribution and morphology protein family 31/32 [Chytriomyces sp. MP71]|nr:mitochondrial distribution and morphology protein family 31/32 [Chytriomyces sp. MP71]
MRFSHSNIKREGVSAFSPTNAELVSSVRGVVPRAKMRLRLLLMGRLAPTRTWKLDDLAALASWALAGTGLVLLASTTTVASLVLMGANSLYVKEYMTAQLSEYLSKATGFDVSFESAILPNWKEGTIQLRNVDIHMDADRWTRRIQQQRATISTSPSHTVHADNIHSPPLADALACDQEIDLNWTFWDLNVKTVDVTLNLWRYFSGLGIIQSLKLTGVRGTADRAHVTWTEDWAPTLREATPHDFTMENVVVEDLLVTVRNPYGFRPFQVSVYSGNVPLLRQQWLLYDIMCADSIVGAFDNCLFSVHKWKTEVTSGEGGLAAEMSHLKINGLPIDHFNAGVTGPMSWITSGTIDIDMHFLFPQHPSDELFSQIRQEFASVHFIAMDTLEKLKEHHVARIRDRTGTEPDRRPRGALTHPRDVTSSRSGMHFAICLNDLRASVPGLGSGAQHVGYMAGALIRPVVAYMNAHRVRIPLSFEARLDMRAFEGAWDFWACGLVGVVAEEVGRALTLLVLDERERVRHLKRIGLWNVQHATKNLMEVVDFVRGVTELPTGRTRTYV